MIRRVQNISLHVDSGDICENRRIGIGRRVGTLGGQVLFNSLLEGICAWQVAELMLLQTKEGVLGWLMTHARRFVHINPNTVNVEAAFGAVERFKFLVPISEFTGKGELEEKDSKACTYSAILGWNQSGEA